ncbi:MULTISPECIES: ABC transporter permease [unclassified Variovorax]|jgi:ABC-2 type transport system permease protein|uniref:ABC transporter permease n=1 Tax=unclassified Variovorax TaxID=663243 RepID=UPI0008D0C1E7|nr:MULTISPECIES: ABC transporter permease [unclassified Variovorax]SEK16274.1 ABC-2 type transport system permease protein [Variovorax sp. OK202]SFE43663.1 ABC-2 type transport system permease protein [Variovorax sp. OK212]
MLLALIKKELLALVRDMHGLAALFLMPMVFIVLMSLTLKDIYRPPLAELAYAIDMRDTATPARWLQQLWQRNHGAPQPLGADWQARLRNGSLKYVIVLEPGLSDELESAALSTQSRIQLLTEPGIDANLFNALRAELVGASGELKARLALAVPGTASPAPDASIQAMVRAERFSTAGPRPTSVQQNVPAWLVFGMFFVVASLSSLFVQERSSGALGRLQSLGVSRTMLLASKALPYLGVNALQAVLMLAAGIWFMPLIGGDALSLAGIHWGALLLSLAAVSLAAVSLSLALACLVRSHAQAATIGPMVNVLMAAAGGIMVPKFVMPGFMQRLVEVSPMNWGLEALLTVLLRGGGVADALPQIGRLVLFAALMFLLAVFLFRRRLP